jgi:two-component system sensor histidine kinase BaeS
MRTLRGRLFAAILGTVLLAVGVSLALGIVLTREAVRDSIAKDLGHQADAVAQRLSVLPTGTQFADAPTGDQGHTATGPADHRGGRPPFGPPPGGGERPGEGPGTGPGGARPQVVDLGEASSILPTSAVTRLRAGQDVNGTATIDGKRELFAARPVRGAAVILTRSSGLGLSDYRRYMTGLLLASALAALLAGAAAVLIARRLSAPLKRVAEASRTLAAGKAPAPVPRDGTVELAALADAFNEMASQLARAREAERAVLLSVSHELRTPLTAIRGYAEGIEDGTIEPLVAAEVVGRESVRLERLVQDLLALARLEQGVLEVRPERIDLDDVAHDVERRLLPQARARGVEIAVEANGPAPALADRDRTVQVVSNLVENALRVTPSGGSVRISATPARIEVADTGPGIAAEDLPHVFERFHLYRRRGGSPDGSGLGLAIVRQLADAMGGEVAVRSEVGQGAVFQVRLPAA